MEDSRDRRAIAKMLPNRVMVDAIMRFRFPFLGGVTSLSSGRRSGVSPEYSAKASTERERLESLTYTALSEEHDAMLAETAKRRQAEADAREASQSFNQAAAMAQPADFDEWVRRDIWSLDEMVCLLLGREPDRVRVSEILSWTQVSPFAQRFVKLRETARRSQALGGGLAPIQRDRALEWAMVNGVEVPAELVHALGRLLAVKTEAAKRMRQLIDSQIATGTAPAQPLDQPGMESQAPALVAEPLADAPPVTVEAAVSHAQAAPRFSMKKHAMVQRYRDRWPTIESDMSDASKNGLKAAKAGVRDWDEEAAVAWAKSKGKFRDDERAEPSLQDAMSRLASLPSRKHSLE